ncbi:MFS transporter [Microbulbifer echini]|uniref:MFS transporter n=1 Tax=Microbulbifer echini TaxID=1529067 RepID=A0ABV4NPJ7_9GAMM|nr:MFS transporter [uncultured Microbulbifer sp.]
MADNSFPLNRDRFLALTALSFAVFLVANDLTVFPAAIPTIELEFNSTITRVQWIINGYILVFGVLIIMGGRLADIYGRRRIFFIGAVIFAFFSLLAALAIDLWMLLVARALMGVGGALMWPAILGMVYGLIPKEQSGLAGGLILGVCGVSDAIGPILGGFLTEYASWRWIFLLDVVVAALVCFACWGAVADDRPENISEHIDYLGVTTLAISLFSLLVALDLAVEIGFKSPLVVILFIVTLLFLGGFLMVERNVGSDALIPEDVAKNRWLIAACIVTLLLSVVYFSMLLYIPVFLYKVRGYSPTFAGIGLMPMMITYGLVSYISGRLYEKLGAKVIIAAGSLCICVGMFMLSHINENTSFQELIPGLLVVGAGIGFAFSTVTTAAITNVASARSSLAGGIIYMFQIAGGALGLGMNTTVIAMSPDLSVGIDRAFTINAYLALIALVISVFFDDRKVSNAQS